MQCIELCAGMGGMTLGLEQAGFAHALLVERDAQAVAVLRANFPHAPVRHADVRDVDFAEFRGRVSLVAGGVPCQPFSTSGVGRGEEDERNLFDEAVRCVREVRPRAFLFENVPGLMRSRFRFYIQTVLTRFRELGYDAGVHEANAADYGCAQTRRRCFVVGTLQLPRAFTPPAPTVARYATVREVFAEVSNEDEDSRRRAAMRCSCYRNHVPRGLDAPSKTLLSGINGPGGGANCVRLDDGTMRRFTVPEMARLQGFPSGYRCDPVFTHANRQLGNAAPPPMVLAFAERLSACLQA